MTRIQGEADGIHILLEEPAISADNGYLIPQSPLAFPLADLDPDLASTLPFLIRLQETVSFSLPSSLEFCSPHLATSFSLSQENTLEMRLTDHTLSRSFTLGNWSIGPAAELKQRFDAMRTGFEAFLKCCPREPTPP